MAGNDVFGIYTASPRSRPSLRRSNTTRNDRPFTYRDASPTRGRSSYRDSYEEGRSRRSSPESYSHRSGSTRSERGYNVRHVSPARGRPPHRDSFNPFTPKPYGFGFGEGPELRTVSPIRRHSRSSSTYSHHDPYPTSSYSGHYHGQGDYPPAPPRRECSSSTNFEKKYDVRDVSPPRGRHRSRRDSYHSDDGFEGSFGSYGSFGAKPDFATSSFENHPSSSGAPTGGPRYDHDPGRSRYKATSLTVEELPDYVQADRGSHKLYEYAGTEDPEGEKLTGGSKGKSRRSGGHGRSRAF